MHRIEGFGADYSPAVWTKHLSHLDKNGADSSHLRTVLKLAGDQRRKLTRRDVRDAYSISPATGVVASIVWGFPKGGRPGGIWQPFAEAFHKAPVYASVLADIAQTPTTMAFAGITALNEVQHGVGFATTTKIAYFAGVRFLEGPALIFDKNVIQAIRLLEDGSFRRSREGLGDGAYYHKAVSAYGHFLTEASQYAHRWAAVPDQVEVALFLMTANKRSGWT